MKKTSALKLLLCLFIISGCKEELRIHSVAVLEKGGGGYASFIADTLAFYGLQIVDEDSISSIFDEKALNARKMRLCAGARSDRLDGAVLLGKELDVSAVIFAAMPLKSKAREPFPCMVDSLISLYLVDPPRVLVEAKSLGEFLYRLEQFDWETIVKPPPEPEEFSLAEGETLSFAGYKIVVLKSIEELHQKTAEKKDEGKLASKNRTNQSSKVSEPPITKDNLSGSWEIVIMRNAFTEKRERFEMRTVGSIPGKLKYDVSITTQEPPIFKLILTDLGG